MSGRSGSAVAAHTKLVHHDGTNFAVSPAQYRLLQRAGRAGGGCYVQGSQERSAAKLVNLKLGTTEAECGPNVERVFFMLADGVLGFRRHVKVEEPSAMAPKEKVPVAVERAELRALLAHDKTGEWSDDAGDESIGSVVAVTGHAAIAQVMQRGPVRRAEDLIERKRLTRQIAMLHNLTPGILSELDGLRDVLTETRKLLASILVTLAAGPAREHRRVKQTIDLIDYALRDR